MEPSGQEGTQAESSCGFRCAGGLPGATAAWEGGGVERERESKLALDSVGGEKMSFEKGKLA